MVTKIYLLKISFEYRDKGSGLLWGEGFCHKLGGRAYVGYKNEVEWAERFW